MWLASGKHNQRTEDEQEAFKRALHVMADVYASAVGTTVLQIKEIPPRPEEFDGALCLFELADGADETAIRAAFRSFGGIKAVESARGTAVIRFASHSAATAAKKLAGTLELCKALDFQYNERSYDERIDDGGDGGRGWCAAHQTTVVQLLL